MKKHSTRRHPWIAATDAKIAAAEVQAKISPIPHNGLFDTPTSPEDLINWCMLHSGAERTVALTAAFMAMNMAHHLVRAAEEA